MSEDHKKQEQLIEDCTKRAVRKAAVGSVVVGALAYGAGAALSKYSKCRV